MTLDQEYVAAFTTAYPQKKVEVLRKFNRQGQLRGFQVSIDGDKGDMLLSVDDMRFAIRNFRR